MEKEQVKTSGSPRKQNNFCMHVFSEKGLIDLVCYLIIAAPVVAICWILYTPYKNAEGIPPRLAWFAEHLTAVVIPLLVFFKMGNTQIYLVNYILFGMFLTSYIQRAFVIPLVLEYGRLVPFVPFFCVLVYNSINGYSQARYLTRLAYYRPMKIVSFRFLTGVTMFALGLAINWHSAVILRDAGYKVPYGGMFEFVSCANLFGEIVVWWGFTMASWNLPALAHAIFTTVILTLLALAYHDEYLYTFRGSYPRDRAAVIPYIL